MSSGSSVIVIGGGVIGCSIAFHLAKAGVGVTLLERGQLGAEASGAASGVLSFSPGNHPYSVIGRQSLAMFHELAPELKESGGVDIELEQCGELDLALNEDEAIELRTLSRRLNQLGSNTRWLGHAEVRELEPGLNESIQGGMYTPEVCRVNNQRLSEAFARAAVRHGADVRSGTEVVGVVRDGERVTGVRTYQGELRAGHVVLASGAWSTVLGDMAGVNLPVRPVRGVNLNLQPVGPGFSSVIHASWGILVPRNDGSVIAGGTLEEAGFDSRPTAAMIQAILALAGTVFPSLRDASLNWSLAGLRPGSPDDMPIMGPVPGMDGLIVASGHYRNGILLAPVTGKLIADYITGGNADLLKPFSVERFRGVRQN
jgi:glycine oxidase